MLRLLGPLVTRRTDLGLCFSCGKCTTKAPPLDPDDHVHGVKCGLQIFTSGFVLTLKLLDVPIELALHSADLLLEQIGTVLQVATDVTHLITPPNLQTTALKRASGEQFRLISSEPSIRSDVTFQQRSWGKLPS